LSDDDLWAEKEPACQTLWRCFVFSIVYGLRSGGGVADFETPAVGLRYLWDFLFFFSLNLIMLNIVFGIIIDTFGEMRQDRDIRDQNINEVCFICSISKEKFDRESALPEGFRRHIKKDHRMWNYLFFIFHLWEQDKDDDDGLEWYIRKCVNEGDLSWFPIKKAMCLTTEVTEEDQLRNNLDLELVKMEKVLEGEISGLKDQLKQSIADIIHTVLTSRALQGSQVLEKATNGTSFPEVYLERNILLTVLEISDLKIKDEELKSLNCRIITEEGLYSVECVDVHSSCAFFEETSFLVAQSVPVETDKNFRIQILQGNVKSGSSKFVAIVEVSLKNLLFSDGLQLELPFFPENQDNPAFLLLMPSTTVTNATDVSNVLF
jgi:hypothetical protein